MDLPLITEQNLSLRIAIPGSRITGSRIFFNPEIPGLCETESRDLGIGISRNVMLKNMLCYTKVCTTGYPGSSEPQTETSQTVRNRRTTGGGIQPAIKCMVMWAHPASRAKWHLDRFSRFCRIHLRYVGYTDTRTTPHRL